MLRTLFIAVLFLQSSFVMAREIRVPAHSGALVDALKNAKAGDIIRLQSGTYEGSFTIDTPITLDGAGKAAIVGNEIGSVISVLSPDVTIKGLTVTGSGSKGDGRDAGIYLSKKATNAVVSDNRILGNLVGVDVHGSKNALVTRNVIEGRQDFRMNDRGNGVYVWNAPGAKVIQNDFRWGRDGIFVNTSKRNEFSGNRFRDLRFAVHYMYANDSIVTNNLSEGNHLGYAIMYSRNVVIKGNYSKGDRDHGIMMNYTNSSTVSGNHIESVDDKCVFIYNAHKNRFEGNYFAGCGIGIHFTAGSERNQFSNNAFVANRTQVKYVGSRWIDWSVDGKGNYWSDHAAFDLDGNGIADNVYRPNDIMDHILWTQPAAKALLGSPAVQLIRWSQSTFPALLPGGVVDRAPLMQPKLPSRTIWEDF
ncbi:nitrous oxide reductase family maturation protein NosD [Cohaesibacter intestini]|uniref:nitrous oxide reductase family maturation protein NosD n=1 Tax=Cohaesibacter intestini TaxID=2211145 RepID=UPI000DE8FA7C|nr:nitrous oxide reductase family maturation protein NosD [Cohaesibacter intestini]